MSKHSHLKLKKHGTKLKGALRKTSAKEKQDIKRVILVDCSSVTYAAFHAFGHLSYNGMDTGVIYGFLSRLLAMAEKFKSDNFILCWDAGKSTQRLKVYPEYKAKRQEKRKEFDPDEQMAFDSLQIQTKKLYENIIPQMGFGNSFQRPGWEADDLLGWWVNKLSKHSYDIIMVTSDADLYQCLDRCRIWSPLHKKYFTQKMMLKKYNGTTPAEWPMAKAIGGCSGDGVIGIQGISDPKNPKSKVHKYLHGELTKGVVVDRIKSKEGKKIIKRNLPLVTVPYNEGRLPRMLWRKNNYSRFEFLKVFDFHQFISFMKKDSFDRWEAAFNLRR